MRMGTVMQARMYMPENQAGLLKPIIYCCSYKGITENAVSLNKLLAEALIKLKPMRRTMQIEKCFAEIIGELPEKVVIKDFDVLFNPDYKVDILKVMVNVCKTRPFSVVWPGKINGNKLMYAEEGYKDYKEYDVDDYDITCII